MCNQETARTRGQAGTKAAPRWWLETRRLARLFEWPAVAALWVISLILGTWGYSIYFPRGVGETLVSHLLDAVYRSLQLIALEFNWQEHGAAVPVPLQVARLVLPPIAGWAAIRALGALFREQAQLSAIQLFYRRHVIVCGLGQKGMALVKGLRARGERVVVVELDAENDFIGPCRDAGATVLVGDATTAQTLKRAGIAYARLLVAMTPQDSTNVEIADRARSTRPHRNRRETLTCIIHLLDARFCHDLQGWALTERSTGGFRLELFNIYRDGARRLCRENRPFGEDGSARLAGKVLRAGRMRHPVSPCRCRPEGAAGAGSSLTPGSAGPIPVIRPSGSDLPAGPALQAGGRLSFCWRSEGCPTGH